jgi:hypothetical protein
MIRFRFFWLSKTEFAIARVSVKGRSGLRVNFFQARDAMPAASGLTRPENASMHEVMSRVTAAAKRYACIAMAC